MTNIFRRRKLIALMAIAIFAAGAYFIFRPKSGNVSAVIYNYGTAQIGTISQSVSGTGQIKASRQTGLTSQVSGDVLNVGVEVGQQVKAGTIIANLDNNDAQNSVKDAREAVDTARLSLEKINEPADSLALTQAQNAVKQANESLANSQESLEKTYEQGFNSVSEAFIYLPDAVSGLQDIVTGSSPYVVQSSPTYLEYYFDNIKSYEPGAALLETQAASAYQKARAAYDKNFQAYKIASRSSDKSRIESLIDETYETSKTIADALKNTNTLIQRYKDILASRNMAPQSFAVTQVAALSGYITGVNSRAEDLYSASQNIQNAKALIASGQRSADEKFQSLAKIEEGPDTLDVRSQELVIAQKERVLADVEEKLSEYNIAAPFDGVIADIDINKGDSVSVGDAIATVITSNQIATVSLNEVDIAKVEIGQKATLAFSAIDGLTMTGKVAEVAQIGTVSQGVVSYDVVIALDTQDPQVKSGMSVTATIITRMKQNVLLVPSEAVKTSNGGSYVLVAASTTANAAKLAEQQTVATGLSDDISTEITQGLSEGDIIIASSKKAAVANQTSGAANNSRSILNFGGGPGR